MITTSKINGTQLAVLLIISRVFAFLTFTPKSSVQAQGYVVVMTLVISAIIQLIIMIPIFILFNKNKDCGIIDCSFKVGKVYGKVVAFLFFLLMIVEAINTVSNFEFFLTSSVYPRATGTMFIIVLMIATAYSAYMGIQAFARLSGFVLIIVIIGTITLMYSVSSHIDMVYMQNPFGDGIKIVLQSIYGQVKISFEIAMLMLLAPFTNEKVIKPTIKFLVISVLYFEAITFIVLTSLGNYVEHQIFPVYTMAVISELSILQRLDAIYMGMWIFVAFIRVSVVLYLSVHLLKYLIPEKISKYGIVINSLIVVSVSLYLSGDIKRITAFSSLLYTSIPTLVFVIIIPILTLFLTRKKNGVSA